ncbi:MULTISPECIES: multicopper oxidase family protein [unclassified Streptomyces]|uniref:multicopper oxidase family protein n=1 Tax=unclassified Streptomyces TaxID=2593676 RepID=UPI0038177EA3
MSALPRRGVLKCLPVAAGAAVLAGPSAEARARTGGRTSPAGPVPGGPLPIDEAATGGTVDAVDGFPQPEVRSAPAGSRRLATRLTVAYTERELPGAGTVSTRTYEGGVPGPTLRLRAGDELEITHVNALPAEAGGGHDRHVNVPHRFNTFNLHAHGMHVDPTGEADNVFRAFDPAVTRDGTTTHRTTISVPDGHPAGTFWYHPHHHGSTATQLLSGMAGVIVVEGDVDEVPEIAAAREVVVCVNELRLDGGRVPDLTSEGAFDGIASTFLVNGARNPVLTLAPGEVQRWRIVHAGALTGLTLRLDGHELHQIARDGITFMAPVTAGSVALPMGGRADVLVRGGAPGTYELITDGVDAPLMTVVVTGAARDMALPKALPGRPTSLPEPTRRRDLTFRSYSNVFTGDFRNAYRILGEGETPHADTAAGQQDLAWGRFAPDFVNHRVRLGEVEEWTIANDSHSHPNHPFHLHTNHFLVTAVNNRALAVPVWHDTVSIPPRGTITFRLRAEDFTGRAMLHCHQVQHGDEGMMQIVEYVN